MVTLNALYNHSLPERVQSSQAQHVPGVEVCLLFLYFSVKIWPGNKP